MKVVTLTASANTGIGLFTSICVACASIMGVESKNYHKKTEKVLDEANKRLMKKFEDLGPGYSINEYRVVQENVLSDTVSMVAVKECCEQNDNSDDEKQEPKEEPKVEEPKHKVCPKCGAPIDDDMLFCGECGEKLK